MTDPKPYLQLDQCTLHQTRDLFIELMAVSGNLRADGSCLEELWELLLHDFFYASDIFRFVDSVSRVINNNNLDLVAILKALQLLEILLQLERSGRESSVCLQELTVIALETQVKQIIELVVDGTFLVVWEHSAREIDSVSISGGNALHTTTHGDLFVLARGACGTVHSVRCVLKTLHNLINDLRLHQWLVTLNVHNDIIVLWKGGSSSIAALSSVGDIRRSHDNFSTELLASSSDAFVVGCNHNFVELVRFYSLLVGALNHRLSSNHHQRLAWEAS
mmetsp:Transcript_31751/g.38351  ORF Transcript_31751/g.38351 Transcript_31751/m.38351 type:complete len:277 (-) Transcript_31751:202-1032(-)